MRRRSILPILTVALALSALSATTAAPLAAAELQVFAAASLTDALREISAEYAKTAGATGDRPLLNLGASSTLARQIQEGAPADLFLSADEAKMDGLEKRKLLLSGTRRSVLSNALVVVVPVDSNLKISGAADLAGRSIRALALAEPRSVPAGIYAREYLQRKGLWSRVIDRVVPTENVRAALAAVESGNVDAGIVYRTDAGISKKVRIAYEVPQADAPKISYPFAVLAESERREAARRFLDYLVSPPSLAVFRKHGFLVLGN
jgi:molybdate transport system substrate-binding protein